jgi:integrase
MAQTGQGMARTTINRLSDRKVRNAKLGMHPDGGGLYLRVTEGKEDENGAHVLKRYWLFRYKQRGTRKDRQRGIGPLDTISLAQARNVARACREQLLTGLDPVEQRGARRASQRLSEAKAMTFDECRHAYYKAHRSGWRNPRHAHDWDTSIETYVSPVIGNLPVEKIDTALVMRCLEPQWAQKTETLARVRARIEVILDWARVRGYRSGENPARWRGHLDKLLPSRRRTQRVKHFEALPYTEVGAFMKKLRAASGRQTLALQLIVLTAVRSGEALKATWNEFDIGSRVWTIPASHTKRLKELRVPLSDEAIKVLLKAAELRYSERVFPIGHGAPNLVLRDLGYGATVHGMRACFRTWAAERTNFPRELAEVALGHSVGDETEQAYQRGDLFDKRRRLMTAWAEFCSKPAGNGEVVALRNKAPA